MRVLRARSLPPTNPYGPARAVRYDDLYGVTGYAVVEAAGNLHRFALVRRPNQAPIRYRGPEKRPSVRELDEFAETWELAGLSR